MMNLQQLRQQVQNELQVDFESNKFYYQNQNPQVPNGFTPIDQINNFDQVKDNLKTQNTTTQTTYHWGVVGSHEETRYRSRQPYSVLTGSTRCRGCGTDYLYED